MDGEGLQSALLPVGVFQIKGVALTRPVLQGSHNYYMILVRT